MERYIEVTGKTGKNDITHIRLAVRYDVGGFRQRGYYATAFPVERRNGLESIGAYTGYTHLIKPVKRKSKKAETEAQKEAEIILNHMVERLLAENNLRLS